jgi:hypothetical protein
VASTGERPEAVYGRRREAFAAEAEAWGRRFNGVANWRFVAFVMAAAATVWGFVQAQPLAVAAGAVCLLAFVWLVRHHADLGQRRDRAQALAGINAAAGQRLKRAWDTVPLRNTLGPDPGHPYAADLDLFGHASLVHLLDTPGTVMGRATLATWLLQPAASDTVLERQRAVLDLAPRLNLRQDLQAAAATTLDPQPVLAWAESQPWLRPRTFVVWSSRLSPIGLCILGGLQLVGWVNGPWWALFLLVNVILWQVAGKRAYATLSRIDVQQPALKQYAASFGVLADAHFESPRLRHLAADSRIAQQQIGALERITRFVIPRSAQVYWVVQPLLLWDMHVLGALEAWQQHSGARVRAWLSALGDIEALAAFAELAHAHPDWSMPLLDQSAVTLTAHAAGHPLLAPEVRVDNDVEVGPPGAFVLVTGSNMAGKSTYLRTIGTNIVLAQAGAPVCARSWRMPPLELCTSMRVVDSLERGVSTFLAEVLRLKQVVDTARRVDAGPPVCFLLDEVLQGTNTAERQIAARQVIRFLLQCGAMGAVSTHDLGLVDEPELQGAARMVHFTETLTEGGAGPLMTFDHRLRPGLATSTNALRLVALLGLDRHTPDARR